MDDLERALGTLTGRLVHDLKNPLAVVLSNLRYLRMSISEGDEAEAIDESLISAEKLDRILGDVMDLQRFREGEVLDLAPISLKDMGVTLRSQVVHLMGHRTLEIDLPDVQIKTHGELLSRVLINLLEAALRNTPSHGRVVLSGQLEGGLKLMVSDEGAPFEPHAPPSFLADQLQARLQPPTGFRSDQGLGLFFAGQAARALGAQTEIFPRADGSQGLIFQMRFPYP